MSSVISDPRQLSALFGQEYKTSETQRQNALNNYHENQVKRRRQIIITQLNNGTTKRPNPSTIEKYKLSYDTAAKRWI